MCDAGVLVSVFGNGSPVCRRCGVARACVWPAVQGIELCEPVRDLVVYIVLGYAYKCKCDRQGKPGQPFDVGFGEGCFCVHESAQMDRLLSSQLLTGI